MPKFLIAVLVVIVLLAGLYFVVSGRKATQNLTPSQQQSQVPPSPSLNDDSDQGLDNEMTALDRELTEADASEKNFINSYQGL